MQDVTLQKFWTAFLPLNLSATQRLVRLLLPVVLVLFVAALASRLWFEPARALRYEKSEGMIWIWLHLATVVPSILLAIYLLAKPKGTPQHRLLGKIWCGLMVATAIITLNIHAAPHPRLFGLGPIHIFSIVTLIGVPRLIFAARRHDVAGHQMAVYGLCLGGLFIAGLFTFMPDRLLGRWLFGG